MKQKKKRILNSKESINCVCITQPGKPRKLKLNTKALVCLPDGDTDFLGLVRLMAYRPL